jgi:hypothetical protein
MWQLPTTNSENITGFMVYRRCVTDFWDAIGDVVPFTNGQYTYEAYDPSPFDGCLYAVKSFDAENQTSAFSNFDTLVMPDMPADEEEPISDEFPVEEEEPLTEAEILQQILQDAMQAEPMIVSGEYLIDAFDVGADIGTVSQVELHIKKDNALYKEYVGQFEYKSQLNLWQIVFDSTQYPNGNYVLVPRGVTANSGTFWGTVRHIRIANEAAELSAEEIQEKAELIDYVQDVKEQISTVDAQLEERTDAAKEKLVSVVEDFKEERQEVATEESIRKEVTDAVNRDVDDFTALSLERDTRAAQEKKARLIEQFSKHMVAVDATSEKQTETEKEEAAVLRDRVAEYVDDVEDVAEERSRLLGKRVRADVFKDSDSDGISNFDEVNIYKTDPYVADSDRDGVFDGAEIAGGYDPLDDSAEAQIEYEEVKTAGVLNTELFAVKSVKAVVKEIEVPTPPKQGVASGTAATTNDDPLEKKIDTVVETTVGLAFEGVAPPNSFVTLYIYSTPIIVTVKTDSDGNWQYELDKELENGEHQVYVAMTDNAGAVYMKSNPLNFVKEAQAVTFEQQPIYTSAAQPSFLNERYLYTTITVLIIIIAVALVFMGARRRDPEELEIENE